MGKLFENLGLVLILGFALAGLIAVFPDSGYGNSVGAGDLGLGVFQWLHVFFGITWIGLLYYFNFVQTPVMPTVPAELKQRMPFADLSGFEADPNVQNLGNQLTVQDMCNFVEFKLKKAA